MKANRMPRPPVLTFEERRAERIADIDRCTVGGKYETPDYPDMQELLRLARAIHPKARFVETMYEDEDNPPTKHEASIRVGKRILAYASRAYYGGGSHAFVRQDILAALLAYKPLPRPAPGYQSDSAPLPLP